MSTLDSLLSSTKYSPTPELGGAGALPRGIEGRQSLEPSGAGRALD